MNLFEDEESSSHGVVILFAYVVNLLLDISYYF